MKKKYSTHSQIHCVPFYSFVYAGSDSWQWHKDQVPGLRHQIKCLTKIVLETNCIVHILTWTSSLHFYSSERLSRLSLNLLTFEENRGLYSVSICRTPNVHLWSISVLTFCFSKTWYSLLIFFLLFFLATLFLGLYHIRIVSALISSSFIDLRQSGIT